MQILNSPINAQADAMAAALTNKTKAEDSSAASGSGSASASSGSGAPEAAITANDFLTLLVTEMKNQDPTANTDPNEYITQLVQVNSLQQLISINQEVGSTGTGGSSSSPDASGAAMPALAEASLSSSQETSHPAAAARMKQAAAQVASAGLSNSPTQAMENFAASLHREPSTAHSIEATLAASARRVASAL